MIDEDFIFGLWQGSTRLGTVSGRVRRGAEGTYEHAAGILKPDVPSAQIRPVTQLRTTAFGELYVGQVPQETQVLGPAHPERSVRGAEAVAFDAEQKKLPPERLLRLEGANGEFIDPGQLWLRHIRIVDGPEAAGWRCFYGMAEHESEVWPVMFGAFAT